MSFKYKVHLKEPCSRVEKNRAAVTDNFGRFWLFGGGAQLGYLNDLWIFDSQKLKWEWVSGTNNPNQAGNYGSLGVPSPANKKHNKLQILADVITKV